MRFGMAVNVEIMFMCMVTDVSEEPAAAILYPENGKGMFFKTR